MGLLRLGVRGGPVRVPALAKEPQRCSDGLWGRPSVGWGVSATGAEEGQPERRSCDSTELHGIAQCCCLCSTPLPGRPPATGLGAFSSGICFHHFKR